MKKFELGKVFGVVRDLLLILFAAVAALPILQPTLATTLPKFAWLIASIPVPWLAIPVGALATVRLTLWLSRREVTPNEKAPRVPPPTGLDPADLRAFVFLARSGRRLPASIIATSMSIPGYTIQAQLNRMVSWGLVARHSETYWLTGAGIQYADEYHLL